MAEEENHAEIKLRSSGSNGKRRVITRLLVSVILKSILTLGACFSAFAVSFAFIDWGSHLDPLGAAVGTLTVFAGIIVGIIVSIVLVIKWRHFGPVFRYGITIAVVLIVSLQMIQSYSREHSYKPFKLTPEMEEERDRSHHVEALRRNHKWQEMIDYIEKYPTSKIYWSSKFLDGCEKESDDQVIPADVFERAYLLEKEWNPNLGNYLESAVKCSLPLVEFFLKPGMNPDDGDESLLLHARNHEIFLRLLAAGANPNKQNDKGRTPLMMATRLEVLRWLLEAKADIHALDKDGNTALHIGCNNIAKASSEERKASLQKFMLERARLLIKAGLDVNARNKYKQTPLIRLSALHQIYIDDNPDLPYDLDLACSLDLPLAELLVKNGANLLLRDKDGYLAIHYYTEDAYRYLLKVFKKQGGDINSKPSILRRMVEKACTSHGWKGFDNAFMTLLYAGLNEEIIDEALEQVKWVSCYSKTELEIRLQELRQKKRKPGSDQRLPD